MTTMMNLKSAIDLLCGVPIQMSPGITAGIERPECLTPVLSLVRETVRIAFPQWLPVLIVIESLDQQLYPIAEAIAKNQPVDVGGYAVDFHGQLPRITPRPLQSCVELNWSTCPTIDMRFVPAKFDPVIRSVTLFYNGAQINGHGWSKWVEL